jgi:hypothetical protein
MSLERTIQMLEYLERDVKDKRPAKTRSWYCVKCGASVKHGEAWIGDRGPLCHKHGMRLRIKRVAEELR